VREHAGLSIERGIDPGVLQRVGVALHVPCPVCHAADAPAYNPGFWNNAAHLTLNNCYNYANNQQTDTFAQPGRATGHPITGLSCPGVQPSAVSDGQDKIGCWSHKPGGTPAINTDNSGHAITNPQTCNRGGYTVFCTFMITKQGVHIH
jgi:hypothetical protein